MTDLQLEPVLHALVILDWVGRLDETGAASTAFLAARPATQRLPLFTVRGFATIQSPASLKPEGTSTSGRE